MRLSRIERKRFRVRKKLKNVSKDRYRLSVSRSTKNISAQIIDDVKNITLVSASSIDKEIKGQKKTNQNYLLLLLKFWRKKQMRKISKKFTLIEEFINIMGELKYLLKH